VQDPLRVAATVENVPQISTFVRDSVKRLPLTDDVLFDIDLALEEACTNIARHAYRPGQTGDVQVCVEAADDAVRITLTDWGRPFDGDAAYLAVHVPVEERTRGGMGLLLIHKLMDEVTRTTASAPGGPNVLTMVKHVGSARP
jgi:serine/threonine-protein kinase RsbW